MRDVAQTDNIEHVDLENSWMLSVASTATWISFVLEAALLEGHTHFYSPSDRLEGDWGAVSIRHASYLVEYYE